MTKNRLKIICPECADNLVKDLDNSSYYCKNCNSNFSIYQVYGYEIIELEEKGFRSGSLNIKAGIKKKTQS